MPIVESTNQPMRGAATATEVRVGGGAFRRIVVPVDGSAGAEQVLPLALRIAAATGGDIQLVWVRPTPTHPRSPTEGQPIRLRYLESLTEEVGDRLGAPVSRTVLAGRPAEQIEAHVRERRADLVVMASRGHGGLWRLGIGSTTDALVRSLPTPIIVMRAEEEQEESLDRKVALERIVVALDGSDPSEASLAPAVELALALGGLVTLLRVIETPVLPVSTYMPHAIELTREHVRREMESARAYLDRIAARLRAYGVPVEIAIRESVTAASGILRFAREVEANMIAVATHGRGRASRVLIGSTASRLLHDSGLPVLVTNTSAAP